MSDDIIFNKLDDISKDIVELKVTAAKQEVNIAEHIRRTNMLEEIVLPISTKFMWAEGVLKFLGLVAVGIGAIASGIKLFEFFSHFWH